MSDTEQGNPGKSKYQANITPLQENNYTFKALR